MEVEGEEDGEEERGDDEFGEEPGDEFDAGEVVAHEGVAEYGTAGEEGAELDGGEDGDAELVVAVPYRVPVIVVAEGGAVGDHEQDQEQGCRHGEYEVGLEEVVLFGYFHLVYELRIVAGAVLLIC